jgi:N-acetylglutamate synthase-like GNAT family acetyltransferase
MEAQLAISVRRARAADVPALTTLVNRAYAIEQVFLEGDRTTTAEIGEMVESGAFLVLERDGGLAAAVYVEIDAAGGYFGMLSVDPAVQKMGLGTRLVRIAEAFCEAMGATTVRIRIINLREELNRWYTSLGYRPVGTQPYTHRPAKQPCHFIEMQRSLA